MKIYLASSWRNKYQPAILTLLREAGFEVYDFRNPKPGNRGFAWASIDNAWETWTPKQYARALDSQIAVDGFALDFEAMKWADVCVLLLPAGRSASIEAGWMIGQNKPCVVYIPEQVEPELMYKLAHEVVTDPRELLSWLQTVSDTFREQQDPRYSR